MKASSQFSGRIKMRAHRVNSNGDIQSSRDLTGWFPNIITDPGLDAMGTGTLSILVGSCWVGTGSTTPTAADTALASFLAGTSTNLDSTSGVQASAPYYAYYRVVHRFAVGVAAGNLTEVGIANNAAPGGGSTVMFSRALILDGSGNPTTVTVLADEILDVTYELRNYPNLTDVSGIVSISGIDYNYTIRARAVDFASFWNATGNTQGSLSSPKRGIYGVGAALQPYTGAASLGGTGPTLSDATVSTDAYVPGSYERTFTIACSTTQGNTTGGIQAMVLGTGIGGWQIVFDPVLPKDATKSLTLNFTHGPWGRFTPP